MLETQCSTVTVPTSVIPECVAPVRVALVLVLEDTSGDLVDKERKNAGTAFRVVPAFFL